MANVKFSQFTSARPDFTTSLAGFEVGADNVQITAQSFNEILIPSLSNPGEFSFGATILKNWLTGPNLTAGVIYYWDYNTIAAQEVWSRADNTIASSAESQGLLALCRDTTVNGSEMIAKGVVRLTPSADPAWTAADNGKVVYLGATGLTTLIAPTTGSGDTQRIVGYVLDGPNYIINFDPDYTFIVV